MREFEPWLGIRFSKRYWDKILGGSVSIMSESSLPVSSAEVISARKHDHLEMARADTSQNRRSPGWEDVYLIPMALPELSPADVNLSAQLAGFSLALPIVLVGMTGGHPASAEINAALGEAAVALGIPVGVGSQRAALVAPELAGTFAAIRIRAKEAIVFGNIGAVQLVAQGDRPPLSVTDVARAIEMVRADALAVHLNVVQELLQPEGDRNVGPLLPALAALVKSCPVPVIVKETGAGIDRRSAELLVSTGIAAIDVGGAGGTSFARIEATRSGKERLLDLFGDWGIPTVASVLECSGLGVPVVATGGVRSGLDTAKALAVGATAVGLGRAALLAAEHGGAPSVIALVEEMAAELRLAMVLCGAATPTHLHRSPPVLAGFTAAWATQRCLARGGPAGPLQ